MAVVQLINLSLTHRYRGQVDSSHRPSHISIIASRSLFVMF